MIKPILKDIDGIFLLDKPLHMTSNQALQAVKRLFSAKKAGHTGSLDPLATGMLPICFGEGTKFSQFLLESDKCYQVTVKLGVKTTTGDAEGDILITRPVENITSERVQLILRDFIGLIEQIPPMFSAIKYQGRPLYELARKGIEIERTARKIHIFQLDLESLGSDTLQLFIHCSKGTYVRTLVEDMGEKLGCGAHVIELRRTIVFPYQQAKMISLNALEAAHSELGPEGLAQYLLPIETSVKSFPSVKLSSSAVFYIRTGQPVMVPHLPKQGLVTLFSDDDYFMGVGEVLEDGRVAPRRLINQTKRLAKAI